MAWFGQSKSTIEWLEYRDDVLFWKWRGSEIKSGSRLIIRPGQKAIFYGEGKIQGIFENEGNFNLDTDIVPFLSSLEGFFSLRDDTGKRGEVYFVNAKELTMPWGTKQRIMIPTPEVPSGIPVGANGNLIVAFRDYLTFIQKVAGMKDTYTLGDVSDRIMGEMSAIVAEAILGNQSSIGLNALVALQGNARALGQKMKEELDKELFDIGLTCTDVNIVAFNYPPEVQKMAEKVAGQSFVTDVGRYAAISAADGMAEGGAGIAGIGAQAAVGAAIGQQMQQSMGGQQPAAQQPAAQPAAAQGDRFCPKCRKMVHGNYCPDCGTQTV